MKGRSAAKRAEWARNEGFARWDRECHSCDSPTMWPRRHQPTAAMSGQFKSGKSWGANAWGGLGPVHCIFCRLTLVPKLAPAAPPGFYTPSDWVARPYVIQELP